jgi:hypothetical protein
MDFAAFESGSMEVKESFSAEAPGNQEPDFTKQISSKSICDFFYAFFWVYLIIGLVSLLGLVGTMMYSKGSIMMIVSYIISFGIATTTALFHYLICSRALLK